MLTLAIVISIITAKQARMKMIQTYFLLAVVGFSSLFGLFPEYQGILQRCLYISGLLWLSLYLMRVEKRI